MKKLIIIYVLLYINIAQVFTSTENLNSFLKNSPSWRFKESEVDEYNNLFENYESRSCQNKMEEKFGSLNDDTESLPSKNEVTKNLYDKKRGFEEVAYLFDYLDDLFQKEITGEFSRIWEEAKKAPTSGNFVDLYDLNRIFNNKLLGNSLGIPLNVDRMTDEEIVKRMQRISPSFDIEVYKNSINMQQLNWILKKWGYNKKHEANNIPKYLVDKYDMDGDGRLNAREFILLSIVNNIDIMPYGTCSNCYHEIVLKKVEPIFDFIDCKREATISTQNICDGIMYLRKKTSAYNMFKCTKNGLFFNSSACNDLILKNTTSATNGGLTKSEFRLGILLGFWDRQTHNKGIYFGDEINKKSERWSPDGKIDLFCQRLGHYKK